LLRLSPSLFAIRFIAARELLTGGRDLVILVRAAARLPSKQKDNLGQVGAGRGRVVGRIGASQTVCKYLARGFEDG